uniref:Uncharacterized protein n=1 Tax=Ursus americanus TaxID=9643 RepID=A0A452QH44_URSAM
MVPPSSSQLDGVRSGVFQVLKTLFATSLKVDLIRQVYPQFLDLDNQRKWGILLGNLGFRSPPLTSRGRFKEVCERPNGACQEFCLESELQAGRCLNGQPCCLPMGNEPLIEPTTPKE